jgi:hypothetical protein
MAQIDWDVNFDELEVKQHWPHNLNTMLSDDGSTLTLGWSADLTGGDTVFREYVIVDDDDPGQNYFMTGSDYGATPAEGARQSRGPVMALNSQGLPVSVSHRYNSNALQYEVATGRDPNGMLTFDGFYNFTPEGIYIGAGASRTMAARPAVDAEPYKLFLYAESTENSNGLTTGSLYVSEDDGYTWSVHTADFAVMPGGLRFNEDATAILYKDSQYDPWFGWPGNYPNGYRQATEIKYLRADANGDFTGTPVTLVSKPNDYSVWNPTWSEEADPVANHPQEYAELSSQIIDHDIAGVDITDTGAGETVFAYQIRRGGRLLDEFMSTGVVDLHDPENWQELRIAKFDTASDPNGTDFSDPNNYTLLAVDNTFRAESGYSSANGVKVESDAKGNLFVAYSREFVGGQYESTPTEIVIGTKRAYEDFEDPNSWKWEEPITLYLETPNETGADVDATKYDIELFDKYGDGSEIDVYFTYYTRDPNIIINENNKYKKLCLAYGDYDALPGDAAYDGVVDVGDLGILAGNWGSTDEDLDFWTADFNHDGIVDVGDLGILAGNWGAVQNGGAGVPEPTTMLLLTAAVPALIRRRKK